MSDFDIDLTGMTVLEVISSYPEQALALMRKNYNISTRAILTGAIALAEEFREDHPDQPSTDRVCKLIEFIEEKLKDVPIEERKAEEPTPDAKKESVLDLKTDYDVSKRTASYIPKVYLGQEIDTPLGKGIVISMSMPSNGLYLSPERAELTVWFSTQQAKDGWTQHTYTFTELAGYI